MVHSSKTDNAISDIGSQSRRISLISSQDLVQKLRNLDRTTLLNQSFPTIPKYHYKSQKSAKLRYSVHHFSRLPVSRPNRTKQLGLPTIGKGTPPTQWDVGAEGGCLRQIRVQKWADRRCLQGWPFSQKAGRRHVLGWTPFSLLPKGLSPLGSSGNPYPGMSRRPGEPLWGQACRDMCTEKVYRLRAGLEELGEARPLDWMCGGIIRIH